MYLLIDIGNTRIKWQQRDDKDIVLTDSILVEDFMDINFSVIKSRVSKIDVLKSFFFITTRFLHNLTRGLRNL